MDLDSGIADDFLSIVDGIKRITVNGVEEIESLRRAVNYKELKSASYVTSDTVFHFSAEVEKPAIGQMIVDDDGNWTILEVSKQTLVNRWRCICRQISLDPTHVISIEKATYRKGLTGALEATWSKVTENVSARISIQKEAVETENGNRHSTKLATVYFAEAYELTSKHRIVGPEGQILKVKSWRGFDDIEKLFSAECEISLWPG